MPLANGVKYVVSAFDIYGRLADHKVCEVGKPLQALKLNAGEKYDIIIYSFNNSKEPPVSARISNGFSYNFSNDTKEFLYHKISGYTAIGGEKTLSVNLKHKFSYAKFVLDARSLSTHNNRDVSISNAKFSGVHHKSGKINIDNGTFSGNGIGDLTVSLNRKSTKLYESAYIPISLNSGTVRGTFISDVVAPAQYGEQKQTKSTSINIKSGTRSAYTMKLKGSAFVPDPKCTDPDAVNYRGSLPCMYCVHFEENPCVSGTTPTPYWKR